MSMTDEIVPVVTQTTPVVTASQPVEPVTPAIPSSSGDTTQVVNQAPVATTDAPAETKAPDGERQSTPEPGKKLNPIQERITDLVTERNAAKEYAEYWRQKSLELMRANPVQSQAPVSQPAQPQSPGEAPTLEQHNYDQTAWAKAMSDWADKKADYRFQQNLSNNQVKQAQADIITTYTERVDSFKKDHPDFDIVTTNPRLPQLHPVAAAMVLSSDLGADLTYHLATNVDEAVRIAKLPPPRQANAIGELAAEIRQAKQPKPVVTAPVVTKPEPAPLKAPVVATTSQAPEPLAPVPSGGSSEINPNELSVSDWMKLRVDQTRGRRRGGRVA